MTTGGAASRAAVVAAGVVVLLVAGITAAASLWRTSLPLGADAVSSGSMSLAVNGTTSYTVPGTALSTISLGTITPVELALQGAVAGKNNAQSLSLDGVTATNPTTAFASNLQLQIYALSSGQSCGSDTTQAGVKLYPVGGTTTSTGLAKSATFAARPFVARGTTTVVSQRLCLRFSLPTSTPSTAQNQTTQLTFLFSGNQVRP